MKRPSYLFIFGIPAALVLSVCAFQAMYFSDAVTPDPRAPLTHAAEHVWLDCVNKARSAMIAGATSEMTGVEVEIAVRKSCTAESDRMVAVATSENGRDYGHDLEKRELSARTTGRYVTEARARAAGADAVVVPPFDGGLVHRSRAEFDSKLTEWDACMSSAALHFALGNPHDPPEDLARDAEDFCAGFYKTLSFSTVTPPLGDSNRVGKFVQRHGRERLPELTKEIAAAQPRPGG